MATRHAVISLFLQEKSAILRKSRTKEGLLNPDRRRTHYLLGLIAARRLLAVKRAVWVKSSHKDVCEAINIYPPHMAQEINWIFPRERRMDTAIICCTTLAVPNPPPLPRADCSFSMSPISCLVAQITSRKFNYTKYGSVGTRIQYIWCQPKDVLIISFNCVHHQCPSRTNPMAAHQISGAHSDQSHTT